MCQVIPFTLPCCRRIYVGVTKLPSCPENWPKSKCPPELCIQIFYEPDERATGTCWRCKAKQAGVPSEHRAALRPGIDNADIVIGLEELGPDGRRQVAEKGGHCWFCGSRPGCETCGEEDVHEGEKRKLSRKQPVVDNGKPVNKRLKIECGECRHRVSPHASLNIRNETYWQSQNQQVYGGSFGGSELTYDTHSGDLSQNAFSQQAFTAQPTSGQWQHGKHHQTGGSMPNNLDPNLNGMNESPLSKSEPAQDSNFNQYPYMTGYPAVTNTRQQSSTQGLQPQVSLYQPAFANTGNGEQNNCTVSEDMDDLMFSQMLTAYNIDLANNTQLPGYTSQCGEESHPASLYSYPSPKAR